jgi:hypothetical protein
MTETRFAISKTIKYDDLTMTVTIRQGATEQMVRDTLRHYVVAANAIRKGTEVPPSLHLRDDYGQPPDHGCTRVNIFGDVNSISINKCNEFTTAMDLVTNAAMLKLATDLSANANGSKSNEKGSNSGEGQKSEDVPTPPQEPPIPPPEQQQWRTDPRGAQWDTSGQSSDPGKSESPFRKPEQRAGTVTQPIEGSQRGKKYSEILESAQRGQMLKFTIVKIGRKLTEDGSESIYEFTERYGNQPGKYPIIPKAYTDNDGDMLALKTTLDALNIGPGEAREGKWELLAEVFESDTKKTARPRSLKVIEPERVEEPF